jgi:drug/metabolite transporter (DMT)-like permease
VVQLAVSPTRAPYTCRLRFAPEVAQPEACVSMVLHQASGRWKLGLLLAFLTAALWATLPVALKIALVGLDPITLTWFRFVFAALGLGLWLAWRGQFAALRGMNRSHWRLLMLAAVMLIGNYVFYLYGLHHTTPGNAQLLIQLAPLLMAVGGIVVFGERFRGGQWFGLGLLTLGLGLFFHDQLGAVTRPQYLLGSGMIVIAAVVWAAYALAQKQLLLRLSSPLILCVIYIAASVALLPLARPLALAALDTGQWIALIYCALNTLGAYGAFAEALAHWEASRVSLVLAVTPLLTLACVELASWLLPELVSPERIGAVGMLGALLVVGGSALTSLLGQRRG